ncbi:hypothetical protein TNCV_2495281 [Trichonephila clavipes]|nr:hypothetical protein TNCV_2495281 [Trichonephila clavipes]
MHSCIATAFPGDDEFYQQGNAPCHKSQIVKEWFDESSSEFQAMSWPLNSSVLNPIEIWGIAWKIKFVLPLYHLTVIDMHLSFLYQISRTIYQHLAGC